MGIESKEQIKRGRPVGTGVYDTRLPEIRLSGEQLNSYRRLAGESEVTLSQWVRTKLDQGAKNILAKE